MAIDTDKLFAKTKAVFQKMIGREPKQLTRREVIETLGAEYEEHYILIASALAAAGKAKLKRGPGGIEFPSRQGAQSAITTANESVIRDYLDNNYRASDASPENPEDEARLYGPLITYLESTDLYDHVIEHGDARTGGGTWKNPDVLCLSYTPDLKFSVGIAPEVTAIEVKPNLPDIKAMQQARSYLSFCHASYLCFFDANYSGKDLDYLVKTLRDIEVWDWARDFSLGLIVAYKPTVRSTEYYFQTIREAPMLQQPARITEEALKKYFKEDILKDVAKALRAQLFNAMQQ